MAAVQPDVTSNTLSRELFGATGINPARCYQCGKCTAGCPMASEMAVRPHQIVRLVQLNARARLLVEPSLWLCASCETCSTRCPMNVEPARLIDGLREIAHRERPESVPTRASAFHRAFLAEIARHGRVFELGMVMGYKLRSGALLDDVATAPGMLRRGKLALFPRHIAGVRDVRRIIAACESVIEVECG